MSKSSVSVLFKKARRASRRMFRIDQYGKQIGYKFNITDEFRNKINTFYENNCYIEIRDVIQDDGRVLSCFMAIYDPDNKIREFDNLLTRIEREPHVDI